MYHYMDVHSLQYIAFHAYVQCQNWMALDPYIFMLFTPSKIHQSIQSLQQNIRRFLAARSYKMITFDKLVREQASQNIKFDKIRMQSINLTISNVRNGDHVIVSFKNRTGYSHGILMGLNYRGLHEVLIYVPWKNRCELWDYSDFPEDEDQDDVDRGNIQMGIVSYHNDSIEAKERTVKIARALSESFHEVVRNYRLQSLTGECFIHLCQTGNFHNDCDTIHQECDAINQMLPVLKPKHTTLAKYVNDCMIYYIYYIYAIYVLCRRTHALFIK